MIHVLPKLYLRMCEGLGAPQVPGEREEARLGPEDAAAAGNAGTAGDAKGSNAKGQKPTVRMQASARLKAYRLWLQRLFGISRCL